MTLLSGPRLPQRQEGGRSPGTPAGRPSVPRGQAPRARLPFPGPMSPAARASERAQLPTHRRGQALGPALYLPVPPGGPQDGASAAGEQVGQREHRDQPFPAQLPAGPAVQPTPWARALECPGAMVPGREGAPVGGATAGPCLGPGSPSEQGGVTYTMAPESHPWAPPHPWPPESPGSGPSIAWRVGDSALLLRARSSEGSGRRAHCPLSTVAL